MIEEFKPFKSAVLALTFFALGWVISGLHGQSDVDAVIISVTPTVEEVMEDIKVTTEDLGNVLDAIEASVDADIEDAELGTN